MARKNNQSVRLRDLFVVIFLLLATIVAAITFQLHFLLSTILFFGLPSAYLIYRKPNNLKKATVAGLLFGVLWGFSFDYIAELNHAWGWSFNTALTFPVQFFGVVSLDIMIWYFLWIFFIVAFYEYFAEYDSSKKISKNALWSALGGVIAGIIVLTISHLQPTWLLFTYPYLVLGILALIPVVLIVLRRPSIFPKIVEIVPFFILVYLSFELTALYLHLWSFPGNYIGTVTIFGLTFPFEELFFWVISSSAAAAGYHEYFIDDGK